MKNSRKRMISLLLAFALICTCIPAVSADAANYKNFSAGQYVAVATTAGVNMHANASTSSAIITLLDKGSLVLVNEIYSSGWMKVTYGTRTGYVLGYEGWFTSSNDSYQEYSYSSKQALVKANALNVFKNPVSLESNLLDVLYKGQVVNALAYTNTGWTKISFYRGTSLVTGYVNSAWITVSARTSTVSEKFKKIYGYSAKINTGTLKVRKSPSTSAATVTTLEYGDMVTILAQSTNWYKITLNVDDEMVTGYIARKYTKRVNALANLRLSASTKSLSAGKKYHLLVRGTTGMSVKKTFTTSNKKIATVSKYGYITAKKKGTATITVTCKVGTRTKKLTCKVTVK